jgi:hypothetical protein
VGEGFEPRGTLVLGVKEGVSSERIVVGRNTYPKRDTMSRKYKIELAIPPYDQSPTLEAIERVRRSYRVSSLISFVERWKLSFIVNTDPQILPDKSIYSLAADLMAIKDVTSVRIVKQV